MGTRTDLQTLLSNTITPAKVYFQPPPNSQIDYPCLIYERKSARKVFANDKSYKWEFQYTLTFISRDPDDGGVNKLMALPKCVFDRHFVTSNLNHDVFTISF